VSYSNAQMAPGSAAGAAGEADAGSLLWRVAFRTNLPAGKRYAVTEETPRLSQIVHGM